MTTGVRKNKSGRQGGYASTKPGRRLPCPNRATKYIDDKPYCAMHGPTKYRIDPFYDSAEWRTLRQKTLIRDDYACRYCGFTAHQADHVVPRGKGGADALSNLVACCRDCNKIAAGTCFPSFEAKKTWIIEARTRIFPNAIEKRPTEMLTLLQEGMM